MNAEKESISERYRSRVQYLSAWISVLPIDVKVALRNGMWLRFWQGVLFGVSATVAAWWLSGV